MLKFRTLLFPKISACKVCFSTNAAPALPTNLQLANIKIFEPLPEPLMEEQHFYFPLSVVPKDIEVRKFAVEVQFVEPVSLVQKIFEVPIRKDIIHDVIRYIRHKRRQPKKTKRINELSGSNKKPWAQKGSGRSQVGHKRNSAWRGGEKKFGPALRDYSIDINRKVRALGTMMALSVKHREGNLLIFDNFDSEVCSLRWKYLSTMINKRFGCRHTKPRSSRAS